MPCCVSFGHLYVFPNNLPTHTINDGPSEQIAERALYVAPCQPSALGSMAGVNLALQSETVLPNERKVSNRHPRLLCLVTCHADLA